MEETSAGGEARRRVVVRRFASERLELVPPEGGESQDADPSVVPVYLSGPEESPEDS